MEQKSERVNEPYVGSIGRSIVTTILGSLALATGYLAWMGPQSKSDLVDDQLRTTIAADRAEVIRLRTTVDELRATVERYGVALEAGTGDRFTASDNASQLKYIEARLNDIQRQIDRLAATQGAVTNYLTEDNWRQELLDTIRNGRE